MLQQALRYEGVFWKEKSRIKWYTEGDRNTAFFHRTAKIKYVTKQITILKDNDRILNSSANIESHAPNFYQNLFAHGNNCQTTNLVDRVIPSLVSDQDNAFLTNLPTLEEVKSAVFTMNADGAPGPYGFGGHFYHTYWDIIAQDVFNAVLQFFKHDWLLPNINSSIVALIPKVPNAVKIEQYRPITLANYKFKVITKIPADRLATIAPKIITENQRGFIKGRHISYCIGVASECINLLDKKSFGGQLSMKIDIKKAFDTLDWNFLQAVRFSLLVSIINFASGLRQFCTRLNCPYQLMGKLLATSLQERG